MNELRIMRFGSKSFSTMTFAHDSERLPLLSRIWISASVNGRYLDIDARIVLKFSTEDAKTLFLSTFFNLSKRCIVKK